jgi:polysaccharide export outer membrane protein
LGLRNFAMATAASGNTPPARQRTTDPGPAGTPSEIDIVRSSSHLKRRIPRMRRFFPLDPTLHFLVQSGAAKTPSIEPSGILGYQPDQRFITMRKQAAIPRFPVLFFVVLAAFSPLTHAQQADELYSINPGDVLSVSVWKEEDLNQEVIVRPDGYISFPLVGEAKAAGSSIEALRKLITQRITKYIPDPVVTVSIRQLSGNKVYVIGKVNKPGEFVVLRNVDVMQALSMAGGTSTYAALNKIKILRRESSGRLKAISFEYGDVEKGNNLEQNIVLKAGDVVVVP